VIARRKETDCTFVTDTLIGVRDHNQREKIWTFNANSISPDFRKMPLLEITGICANPQQDRDSELECLLANMHYWVLEVVGQ
jgi:hypothetical protein